MDEQEVARNLMKAAEQSKGRPLTETEEQQLAEFTKSFLLLMNDTEE